VSDTHEDAVERADGALNGAKEKWAEQSSGARVRIVPA
jgi:hypothetical protein